MPEVFRFYGFSFFFYSREHEPLHIHVEGNEGMPSSSGMALNLFSLRSKTSKRVISAKLRLF